MRQIMTNIYVQLKSLVFHDKIVELGKAWEDNSDITLDISAFYDTTSAINYIKVHLNK